MFPKIVVSPNHPLQNRRFHYKPSIWGCPYFWKQPYILLKKARVSIHHSTAPPGCWGRISGSETPDSLRWPPGHRLGSGGWNGWMVRLHHLKSYETLWTMGYLPYQLVISEPSTEEKRVKSLNIMQKRTPEVFPMVSPEKCTYSRRKGDSKLFETIIIFRWSMLNSWGLPYIHSLWSLQTWRIPMTWAPRASRLLWAWPPWRIWWRQAARGSQPKRRGPPLPWHGTAFSEVNSDQFHIISKYGTL